MVVQVQPDWWFDSAYLHHFHILSPPKKENMAQLPTAEGPRFIKATLEMVDNGCRVSVTMEPARGVLAQTTHYDYNLTTGVITSSVFQIFVQGNQLSPGEVMNFVLGLYCMWAPLKLTVTEGITAPTKESSLRSVLPHLNH